MIINNKINWTKMSVWCILTGFIYLRFSAYAEAVQEQDDFYLQFVSGCKYFLFDYLSVGSKFQLNFNGNFIHIFLCYSAVVSLAGNALNLSMFAFYDLIARVGLFDTYRIKYSARLAQNNPTTHNVFRDLAIGNLSIGMVVLPFAPFFSWYSATPNVWLIYVSCIVWSYLNDVFQYLCHLTFHKLPVLYRLHKHHHSFRVPDASSTFYTHVLEDMLVTGLAYMLPFLLIERHPVILLIVSLVRIHKGVEDHSGYEWPAPFCLVDVLPGRYQSSTMHFHHHSMNSGNYHVYWIDMLFGTMINVEKHVNADDDADDDADAAAPVAPVAPDQMRKKKM